MRYLSDLLGRRVRDRQGRAAGRLADLVVALQGDQEPAITALVYRHGRRLWRLAAENLDWSGPDLPTLTESGSQRTPFIRLPREMLLAHDLLDHQVIDLQDATTGRVNDVALAPISGIWSLHGVELSSRALLRRLLPPVFRPPTREIHLLPWQGFELFASALPTDQAPTMHRGLAALHPADIARIAELAPTRQALELVESLEDGLAADTLEDMSDQLRAAIFAELSPERAALILGLMAPNAAADVLAVLPAPLVRRVEQALPPEPAAELHALLTYAKDTAGGLMTTDYVVAPRDLHAREAPAFLRAQMRKPDWVYYIYVVESMDDRRLRGVASLRDLFLADPDQTMDEIMVPSPRSVRPGALAKQVAHMMGEYNLNALPVTDAAGRLLGIVGVDDAMKVLLPANLSRSIPRVFS